MIGEGRVEPMRSVVIKNTHLRYQEVGSGPPLLFLDAEDSYGLREPFIEALSHNFRVIAPQHPGFDGAAEPQWLKTIGDLAYFSLEAREALKLGPVPVVGASLGGWLAAEIALRNPAAFSSLSLLAPLGLRVPGVPFGDIFLWTPPETVRNTFHDEAIVAKVLAREPTGEEVRAALQSRYTTTRLTWNPRFYSPELMRWTERLRAPTQLIWGQQDMIAPIAVAKAWTEAAPTAQLSTLQGCGHLPHVEHPHAVADKIASFIREAK